MTLFLSYLLRLYQSLLSPLLFTLFGRGCRFTPTCSAYAREALALHGPRQGLPLALKRFLRCHPLSEPAHDPVPRPS